MPEPVLRDRRKHTGIRMAQFYIERGLCVAQHIRPPAEMSGNGSGMRHRLRGDVTRPGSLAEFLVRRYVFFLM